MSSVFAWVDFSEQQQNQIMELIHRFREHDTLDELGLGQIRDGFADYFFPGTSTLQTRARYMFFVPWMYRTLEEQGVPSSQMEQKGRDYELRLVECLSSADDTFGVIGIAAGRALRQLPSGIYWTGLQSWGIRSFNGSRREYHASLDNFYKRLRAYRYLDRETRDLRRPEHNWHPGIPDPPAGWPDESDLSLRLDEAAYLQCRINERHPHSLLAQTANASQVCDDVDFLWGHSAVPTLSSSLRQEIDNARNFSDLMQGANLLDHLILARKKNAEERIQRYEAQFTEWALRVKDRRREYRDWLKEVRPVRGWAATAQRKIPLPTIGFATGWISRVLQSPKIAEIAHDNEVERLIRNREIQVKGTRARVMNARAIERWEGADRVGQLDFRWGTVKHIISDIVKGLNPEAGPGA